MDPTVTIGMCVKNGEKFLGDAINSIKYQIYQHDKIEIIFVDDGSTDNTLLILKNAKKKMDIKTSIFSTQWKGTGPARNLILENLNTKYILWVDSDMILSKEYIKVLVNYLEKNTEFAIVKGITDVLDKKNQILALELLPATVRDINALFFHNTIYQFLPGTAGTLCRSEVLKDVGGFDTNIKGAGEDIDMARKVQKKGWKIGVANSVFYETHGHMLRWKDLLKKYYWYGYTSYDLYCQKKHTFSLWRMSPPASLIYSILILLPSFKIRRSFTTIFLPFHFTLKSFVWCFGFFLNQIKI